MLDRYDSTEFETVTYQAETGGLSCPEAVTRLHYYDISNLPTLLFNGTTEVVGAGDDAVDGSAYDPLVQGLLDDPSPLRMEVHAYGFGDATGDIELKIVAEQAMADVSEKVVRIAIVEDQCEFGGTLYDNILRGMLPDVALTADELHEAQYINDTFMLDFMWNTDNLRLVAWVQDDATREMVQMVSSRPVPDFSLRYYALGDRTVITDTAHTFGDAVLFNAGLATDDVTISLDVGDLPVGWDASFRIGLDDHTTFDTTLVPGERLGTNVSITPGGAGQGTVRLIYHSHSGEVDDKELVYSLITRDTEILLVDDDGAYDYETRYFAPALDLTGRSFAIWDRGSTVLDAAVLDDFDVVVWQCGWAFPTVDAGDRAALAGYLDGGGRLFITGQDIGWELNTEGGAAQAWYHTYLHATYLNDDTNLLTLAGVPLDPIGDGITLAISGGDGADNQEFPSDIDPRGADASTVFTYDAARNGAIKADTGTYRVVYFAFGYEAIDNAADRALVMDRVIDWLAPDPLDASDELTPTTALLGNAPNPFNPRTEIRFRLARTAGVDLGVYDLKGRLVHHVAIGRRAAGEHGVAWDGRDDAGRALPTGTYVYRLTVGGEVRSGKMSLVR